MTYERLFVEEGETVLEIVFGLGHYPKRLAESVGKIGEIYGMDILSGILKATRRSL